MTDKLTKEDLENIGQTVVDLLNLPKKRSNGRYNTSWGDKTLMGLGATIVRVVEEKGDND